MSLRESVLVLLLIAFFESVELVPVKSIESNEIYTINNPKVWKLDTDRTITISPPQSQFLFEYPQISANSKIDESHQILKSRIQFPDVGHDLSDVKKIPRRETIFRQDPWRFNTAPPIVSDKLMSGKRYEPSSIQFKIQETKPYQYYWLKQWLKTNIVISKEEDLKRKLVEIDKMIQQDVLQSSYLSLFQTPNFNRKRSSKWPGGKRRDHLGRCTTPFSFG